MTKKKMTSSKREREMKMIWAESQIWIRMRLSLTAPMLPSRWCRAKMMTSLARSRMMMKLISKMSITVHAGQDSLSSESKMIEDRDY